MAVCCGPTINDILMVLEPIALGSLFTLLHHSDKELTNHEKVAVLCDALDGGCVYQWVWLVAALLHIQGCITYTDYKG